MRLAIFSNMEGSPWGASEELWRHAAQRLLERGCQVMLNCKAWPQPPAPLEELRQLGAEAHFRGRPEKVLRRLKRSLRLGGSYRPWLRRARPDLVLINSAVHVGDVTIAHDCRAAGIPYAILLHSLPPQDWYRERDLNQFADAFAGARRCFFVSQSLRELLEERIARRLEQAAVVTNPIAVDRVGAMPWPEEDGETRLACVARCDPGVKGQDVVLKVLGSDRWRCRPLKVNFYGEQNHHTRHLERLAEMHGVRRAVEFHKYTDVQEIWRTHHGLILPSRHDGVPMATVEALMCGRIAIVTDVGRNREFVDEGETGFLAPAATAPLVDAALERAWKVRSLWREMGKLAADRITQRLPKDPVGEFCSELEDCLHPRGATNNQHNAAAGAGPSTTRDAA